MSTRLPKKRDRNQLRLGFEDERRDGRRWCESCIAWVLPEGFDLFHGQGAHPIRPYDVEAWRVRAGGQGEKKRG
jgi:hypothetical protein